MIIWVYTDGSYVYYKRYNFQIGAIIANFIFLISFTCLVVGKTLAIIYDWW